MQNPPQLPAPNSPKSVLLVWLLNLIPFSGAGLIYAMGFKCLPVLMVAWFIELTSPHTSTYVIVYTILSMIGTSQIKGGQLQKDRLKQLRRSDNIVSPDRGTQIPLARDPEFYEQKHKAKLARKGHQYAHDDDHSDHATDLFEAKAHAAELQLKAREQQERDAATSKDAASSGSIVAASKSPESEEALDFRPANAPDFIDDDASQPGLDLFVASPAVPTAVAAKSTADTNVSAGAAALDDPSFSQPYGSGLPMMDLSADAPSVVPDISSMVASSDSAVPEVSSQFSAEALPLPNSDIPSQLEAPSLPAVSLPTTTTFDFSGANSSIGNFEIPKFDFTFQDPLQGNNSSGGTGSAASTAAAATTADKCPKCGEAKNSNFSFCLTCGQTFI